MDRKPDPAPDAQTSPSPLAPEHELLHRLAELDERVRHTQALAARAYEAAQHWPARLDAVRSAPGYEDAFAGEPLVTVRIATYNAADLLIERALSSLLAQSYERWEALVVGDACTDETEERVRSLGDSRIRFWNLPYRGPYPEDGRLLWFVAGTYPANAAMRASEGKWIAPLDHDDEWEADHIEVLLAKAQRTRAELVYGRMRVVDDTTGEQSEFGSWPPRMGQFAFQASIHHAGLAEFEYDINCQFAGEPGDWNLCRRMWETGVRFGYLDRIVGTYHHRPRAEQLLTVEQRLYEEMRDWATSREEAATWWRERAEALELRVDELQRQLEGR